MIDGWIKIHRKLLQWEWFGDAQTLQLFIYLLLTANIDETRWQGVVIKRGQTFRSLKTISAELNMSVQSVRTCIKRLEESNVIQRAIYKRATHQGMLITVCNYDSYQCQNNESNTPPTHLQHTSNTPSTTQKERKEEKEYIELSHNSNELFNNPSSTAVDLAPRDDIDWNGLLVFFNAKMQGKAIPPISRMTDKRKEHVRARVREFGKEAIAKAITNASESPMMNGHNQRGWVATFDWMMLPTNFPKVLEGNYNEKQLDNVRISESERARMERQRDAEEIIARLMAENKPII